MFNANTYKSMYRRFRADLARPVVLKVNTGTAFRNYTVQAFITRWREEELIAGGSIKLGDLRLIIEAAELARVGVDTLEQKDRIEIDGRSFGIIHWDNYSRIVGTDDIASEVTVRG